MLINQNFSIPAGDDAVFSVEVIPDAVVALTNTTIFWMAYEQQHGCVTPGVAPIIVKASTDASQILIPGSPDNVFYVYLLATDTISLLRNYYHEACYFDQNSLKVTVAEGIMTVLGTENRPSGY